MNEERQPLPAVPVKSGGSRGSRPSRKLSFTSRLRKRFRGGLDRLLAADVVWGTLFVVVVLVLLAKQPTQRWEGEYTNLEPGEVARVDIKAQDDIQFINEEQTQSLRDEARDAVPRVYGYDGDSATRVAAEIAAIFGEGRRILEEAGVGGEDPRALAGTRLEGVPDSALGPLVENGFEGELGLELSSIVKKVMSDKIASSKASLQRESEILLIQIPGDRKETISEFNAFLDLNEARRRVRLEVGERLALSRSDENALSEFAASFVNANVFYDPETTKQAKEDAANAVPTVYMSVRQGDLLVRSGETLTKAVIDRVRLATQASQRSLSKREILALLFLSAMIAFFIWRYTRYHQRAFRKLPHLHALLVTMVLSMLVLSRVILWVAREIVDNLQSPFDQLSSYTYLIPLGAGAILVALLANGRIATVYSAFAALLFGATNRWDPHLMLWAFVVQCAGVYAISTYRERAALLRAGLVVGGAAAVTALAAETLKSPDKPWADGLYAAGLAFVSGAFGVGLLISFSLPLVERLFNVLTDIRLLELSNVNNPLLSELAMKAPGSYNHSLVVGTLAEEAARAIGANSLFCRVAAFYHDVGKLNKPEYYVENQRGVNPHDRLSPSMSALIIASHVKDGVKLAREAGLPEQIVDIIPQHHGTKLMTYFYEKAKSNADPSLGPVKDEDFRYPGPKPQTREAAIFMLADSAEAAARTIDEPTANRLKEMIRKVTNAIVLDGQLDSCDLTFADLEKTQDAFLRSLVSMYHHRVDYPGFDFGRSKDDSKDESKQDGKRENGGETQSEGKPDDRSKDRQVARSS